MGTLTENAAAVRVAQADIDAALRAHGSATAGGLSRAASAIRDLPVDRTARPVWLNDGASHVWVDVPTDGESVQLVVECPSTPLVDSPTLAFVWGDGTSDDIGTTGGIKRVSHAYAAAGQYRIDITGTPRTFIPGGSSSYAFTGVGRTTYADAAGAKKVWAIEFGENCVHPAESNNWRMLASLGLRWFRWTSSHQETADLNFTGSSSLEGFDISGMAVCTGLSSVTGIGGLSTLSDVRLPPSLTTLGAAFGGTGGKSGLTDLALPSGLSGSLPGALLQNAPKVRTLVIPDGVTAVGNYLAYNAWCLEELTYGSGVAEIGQQQVYNCNNLRFIRMRPQVPPAIPANAFERWSYAARKIVVPDGCGAAYRTAAVWADGYADLIVEEHEFTEGA